MISLQLLFGLIGPASMIVALIVLALLSQRLGAVTKRAPIYRWFYVSVVLIAVSIVGRLFAPDALDYRAALLYDVPLALGLTLAVVIAWRYWSWLLSERGKNG
ncbi:MAG: hypothetical protein IT324_23885 [Anaerolineae bacterium]|nr:hypothetical protein [Anaerolineae bacterium]